jgi:hypothetical protein
MFNWAHQRYPRSGVNIVSAGRGKFKPFICRFQLLATSVAVGCGRVVSGGGGLAPFQSAISEYYRLDATLLYAGSCIEAQISLYL